MRAKGFKGLTFEKASFDVAAKEQAGVWMPNAFAVDDKTGTFAVFHYGKWKGPMPYWVVKTGPDNEPGINGGLLPRRGAIDG